MNITATIDMTTSDMLRRALVVTAALFFAPTLALHAAENRATEAQASDHGNFGEAIKRDTKAVGAAFKEGAHRIGVASKAVAHEIATAARRGATETRAALRGQKATPAT